jgi:site-specific recombinase XerD
MVALQELGLKGESYFNFINSLQSDVTKIGYRRALIRFMQYFQIKDTDTLVKLPRQDIETYLTKYIHYQKESNRSRSSMELTMFAVNHFCVMNDIVINIKNIYHNLNRW